MPVLNIKDPEAHRLASELARRTGKSITRVVVDALRHETSRYPNKVIDWGRVRAIQDRVQSKLAGRPVVSDDDLYDEQGLPK